MSINESPDGPSYPRDKYGKCENCMRMIKMFAEETTIHGIWQIIRKDRHWFSRLSWFFAFITCLGVCSFFIFSSVSRYLSYEVRTTTSVEQMEEVDFPAITFCNENTFKKSQVGSNEILLQALTAFTVKSRNEFDDRLKEVMQTCKHNETNRTVEDINQGYDFWHTVGIAKGFYLLSLDSYNSALKCWWKNQMINCSDIFLNHLTDHGWCFTVNPHPDIVRMFNVGLNLTDTAYGLNKSCPFLKLVSSGPNNNLRFLLNVHQEEYCASHHDTAGFKVKKNVLPVLKLILIHNPRIQPLFFLERPIYLSPGYESHIGVRQRRGVKQTENLGKCTAFQKLKLYPNATIYFKEQCYLECITRNVYDSCDCVPYYSPPRFNHIIADELGLNYVNICFKDILCLKDYQQKILQFGLNKDCSYCLDPCNDLQYDYLISYSYFPSQVSSRYFSNLTVVNTEEAMRKNYVMVDIYIENMLVNVITETQDFPIGSLIADMGGQLGLLLGMSVLSFFEFIQFIMPMKKEGIKMRNGEQETNEKTMTVRQRKKNIIQIRSESEKKY